MTRSKANNGKYEIATFLGDFPLPAQRFWSTEFDTLETATDAAIQQHAEMIYAHGSDVFTFVTHDDGETVDWIMHKHTIVTDSKEATKLADKLAGE